MSQPRESEVAVRSKSGIKWRSSRLLNGVVVFIRRKPLGAVGAGIVLALILVAIFAPTISPHDPEEPSAEDIYSKPGGRYILGGDNVGRDILSRLFYGARISMYVGVVSVGIGVSIGALLGIVSAYLGGRFDLVLQRFVDALIAFPGLILALAIMAALGASVNNVIIALIVSAFVPGTSRVVRSQALSIKQSDYVLSARAVGCSDIRIIFRHIVPNCMAIYMVLITIQLGTAITTEASLSFLGLGVPPQTPTWGGMLNVASQAFVGVAPWLAIFPGVAIALAVFGANLLGDALRDILDPRLRGR